MNVAEILDFYGNPTTLDRKGKTVHTVKEAQDWCYNWVEVEENGEGFMVITHTTDPHMWAWGGEIVEEADANTLKDKIYEAFERVNWNFPTRPDNIQPWSDLG